MFTDLLVFFSVFLAVFVQTTTGFGLALVSVPLLTAVIGLHHATPFVAVFGTLVELILLIRYREAISIRSVGQLVLAALIGIPLGVWGLGIIDPEVGTRLLGVVVLGYGAYALVSPRLPTLTHAVWAYGFGFAAGVIGGAYAISGPPVIIYGSCRRWPQATFKGNLQGFFLPVSLMILAGHLLNGNVTRVVWHHVLIAIPAITLGVVIGWHLDGRIPYETFRKGVLLLLIVIGAQLIV